MSQFVVGFLKVGIAYVIAPMIFGYAYMLIINDLVDGFGCGVKKRKKGKIWVNCSLLVFVTLLLLGGYFSFLC